MHPVKQYFLEDLELGMRAEYERRVTEDMIESFAEVSGDFNPLHLDEDYAATTMFKGRIAHGMLSAAFISKVFGTVMPGKGSVYISQTLRFLAPVRIDDTVLTTVEVTGIDSEKKRVSFKSRCKVGATVVIDGDALILVPSRARAAAA
ncbi:MAG: MaoC family dehydratase [Thalassobaculum sp.]|uniref:MaoC family dehydratase n=1 Tax=Thalassobaculum sp. TaxID=2022740 RepID=UPI0032EE8955